MVINRRDRPFAEPKIKLIPK